MFMELAWLAPALSAVAFLLIVTVGRALPRGGAFLAPLAALAGFVLFWFVLAGLLQHGERSFSIEWLKAGETVLVWGVLLDPLSVTMLGLVTLVALGIQLYSWAYMAHDERFGWYFAAHALFAASMLALVLADNLFFLYIAWELVGLCSYLLIGFWYERRSAAEAAKKAFITTRLGDVGLLIGVLLLFRETGTFRITEILGLAQTGHLSQGVITAAAVLVFLGAMGKSAQFPLHVWLPDAMEGPTPVSALIHAATMVAAGVYLVARMFPLFELSATAMLLVTVIGLVTALMAGTMALVMTDLKRILAYSTVSHLGFMMLALGAGGFTAAIFHLLVHAFAKAMLFLSAGSVSHATEKLEIREMGGLARRMPVTAFCFTVGALALGGLPPLSGFFSKDEVLGAVLEGRHPIFLALALVAAFLSALYMARALFAVFFGPLRAENAHAHEAPPLMLGPMLLFAFFALTLGFLALDYGQAYRGLGSFFLGEAEPFHFKPGLAGVSLIVALAGFITGWLAYGSRTIDPARVIARFPRVHRLWARKYYLDDAYQWGIDHVVLASGRLVALFDRRVVNDLGVNGTGESVAQSGRRLRYLETGKVYNYAMGMSLGVLALTLVWWLAMR
jgi:NADH-quinone oxidoreductase subunit L